VHELFQDLEGTEAVFTGGVDVAADFEAVLGDVVAGQAAGDFLLGIQGADVWLAEVARRPDARVASEAEDVALVVAGELQQLPAGLLPDGGPGAGDAADGGQADGDGAAELKLQRAADVIGDGGQAVVAGGVPGADEPLLAGRRPTSRQASADGGIEEFPEFRDQRRERRDLLRLLLQQRCLLTDQCVMRIPRRQRLSHAQIMPETTPAARPPAQP